MKTLFSILLLAGHAGPAPVSDREFDRVQEAIVLDFLDKYDPRRHFETVMGRDTAQLFRMLGCDRGYCRDVACQLIEARFGAPDGGAPDGGAPDGGAPDRRHRASFLWAMHAKDPEIRYRASYLFDKLFPACWHCHGEGWFWRPQLGGMPYECGTCRGTGYGNHAGRND